jgi:hypothetical protein
MKEVGEGTSEGRVEAHWEGRVGVWCWGGVVGGITHPSISTCENLVDCAQRSSVAQRPA